MTDELTDRLHQTTMLARSLRGAPLTVLFVMLMLRRSLGVMELEIITGYHHSAISRALKVLEGLGLALQTRRYQGWQLTEKGYQLPLENNQPLSLSDKNERAKSALPDCSSSSSSFKNGHAHMHTHEERKTTTTNGSERAKSALPKESERAKSALPDGSEGYFLPLPPEAQPLVTLLTDNGTPADQARQAIQEALPTSTPAQLQVEINRWLAYCLSEHGRGINTPGLFIASRIASGQYCPAWFKNGELAQSQSCLHCGQPTTHLFLGEPICQECTTGSGDDEPYR